MAPAAEQLSADASEPDAVEPSAASTAAPEAEALPSAAAPSGLSPAEAPAATAVAALESYSAAPSPTTLSPPRLTTPPPLSSRVETAEARVAAAVPPRWIEIARQRPVLWMVGVPMLLASLIVLPLVAIEPPRTAEPAPSAMTSATPAAPSPAPVEPAATPRAPVVSPTGEAKVAELEGKPLSSLSVEELLLLSDSRAARKRQDASALARKLKAQPDTIQDLAVQVELWRLAGDPDTAHVALGAMAQSRTAVGADLLYEVWMSRSMPAATAELAKALLQSQEVRAAATPALTAAVDLMRAESCEATEAALPRAQADGDRRSLSSLVKLNQRSGCGPKKDDDCYPCLRENMKRVTAAINSAKKRAAPSYAR